MFSFRKERESVLYGVFFDISSGSVGVAIVASKIEDKLPQIIFSDRIHMRATTHGNNTDENIRKIREALFSVALTISQNGASALTAHDPNAKITKIYVTCSSPWSYTVARNVHYENDEPFKITPSILDDLIRSAEEEIITHLQSISILHDARFEVVERATVDIAVNEYPVHDPLSLEGKTLDLSHVVGAIPKDILLAIHEVQDKLFPKTELRAHTYMLVLYCVIRDIFPKLQSVCIIDVTSEATEFGIVEHNLLTENISIPFGSHTVKREDAESTDRPLVEIESEIAEYTPNSALPESLILVRERYEKHVEEALTDLLTRRMIPGDIIITAQKKDYQFFKEALENALKRICAQNVRIISIEDQIVREVSGNTEPDTYLALGARFFHKLHGCGEIRND